MASPPYIGLSPQGVVLIVFSAISLILDLPPLIWHVRKRNVAPASLIVWLILLNLMNFINAFIWPDDDLRSRWEGYGLCDVEVKLQIGSWVGLPGALTCIMRALVAVLDTKSTSLVPTTAQKRRDLAFTIVFCFGVPALLMALHYIVQPNRYAVWAISGCTPTFDGSWLSLLLIFVWPLAISILAAYYGVFLIVRMHRYRAEFTRLLQKSNTTKSRFLRLFLLSVTLVIVLVPWEVYILFKNIQYGVSSYSWSRTHSPLWQLIAPVQSHGTVLFDRWLRMSAGFAVFVFFGLGDDAVKMYKTWLNKLSFGRISLGEQRSSLGTWASLRQKVMALFPTQSRNTNTVDSLYASSGTLSAATSQTANVIILTLVLESLRAQTSTPQFPRATSLAAFRLRMLRPQKKTGLGMTRSERYKAGLDARVEYDWAQSGRKISMYIKELAMQNLSGVIESV